MSDKGQAGTSHALVTGSDKGLMKPLEPVYPVVPIVPDSGVSE